MVAAQVSHVHLEAMEEAPNEGGQFKEAWKVTSKGSAMMRGTVVDFSDDRKTFDDGSSYMFGDAVDPAQTTDRRHTGSNK